MSIKKDMKTIVSNSVSVPMSLGATTLNVVADATEYTNKSVGAAPDVVRALLSIPFAAAKGYIMEAEGVSEEEATVRAYRYVEQPVSRTIEDIGTGSGKLLAELLADDEEDDSKASKKAKH